MKEHPPIEGNRAGDTTSLGNGSDLGKGPGPSGDLEKQGLVSKTSMYPSEDEYWEGMWARPGRNSRHFERDPDNY